MIMEDQYRPKWFFEKKEFKYISAKAGKKKKSLMMLNY